MNLKSIGTRFEYDMNFIDAPVKLSRLSLFQIGEIHIEPTCEITKHNQVCSEISYIISGSGTFEQDGQKIDVSAGDIIVSPKTGTHYIQASDKNPLFFTYVGFNLDKTSDISENLISFYDETNQIFTKDSRNIYGYFRKCIEEYYDTKDIDMVMVETFIIQIATLTYRLFSQENKPFSYKQTYENPGEIVYRILKYIEKNVSQSLSVTGISEMLGYSPYYISHVFKQKMGLSLQDYIGNCKIEKAKELLKLNTFTITSVAKQLNYQNDQSFRRAFHKRTGMTPTEYLDRLNI